ncbi:MAG: Mur ligase family protein, partial [Pseudomonadota bacterium]
METLLMLLLGGALAVLLSVRCNTLLVYFQQEEYDDSRFFTAWQNVRLYDVIASLATVVLLLSGWLSGMLPITLLLLSFVYIAIAWHEQRYQFKKPLVNTERVRRIRACALVLLLPLVLIASVIPWLSVLALQLVPLTLLLANKILQPAQQRLNESFVQQARERLAENTAVAIGVTGSFGKTTVKHMLADMLSIGGPVFYSRGSVNTVLGLTRHIRQRLQPSHRFFVAEMGAYQIGSIKRLCEFVKPVYGIVTAVGEAHAERFGSIENTAVAKAELADWVCQHGTRLVTTEAVIALKPFDELRKRHPDKFIVVGYASACDVLIGDSRLAQGKWQIALDFADSNRFEYSLPLLGDHNILNSALAVALIHAIDADLLSRLAPKMADLEQVAHRLELRENPGEPLVLDDAYN